MISCTPLLSLANGTKKANLLRENGYNTQKGLYNIVIYIATEYDFRNICLEKEIDIFPN